MRFRITTKEFNVVKLTSRLTLTMAWAVWDSSILFDFTNFFILLTRLLLFGFSLLLEIVENLVGRQKESMPVSVSVYSESLQQLKNSYLSTLDPLESIEVKDLRLDPLPASDSPFQILCANQSWVRIELLISSKLYSVCKPVLQAWRHFVPMRDSSCRDSPAGCPACQLTFL